LASSLSLAAATAALALSAGCLGLRHQSPPPAEETRVPPGSREDSVLHLATRTEETGETISYVGDRWRLSVDREAGWRVEGDETSTLKLVRDAEGVPVALRMRAYAIRGGMEPKTFLAAHAMWLAEERAPRVEYTWDKDRQAWEGYSVGQERETYYLFEVSGDRAYVLEESAESAALGARAADEFQRIAGSFRCQPEKP
jgi:hypothetical protein